MVSTTHVSLTLNDRSYASLVKRQIHRIAVEANFKKTVIDKLDIIIAELTSNLVKHANGGELLVAIIDDEGEMAIEVICIDNGPGIRDVKRMLLDGISTTKTLGQGLGSIQRLSDRFDIYSQPNWGTIILSRLYKNKEPQPVKNMLTFKPLIVARVGELACGDAYYVKNTREYIKILAADGLGHGPHANYAVSEAVNAFKLCPDNSPVENLRFIHASIKKTRGAVILIMIYHIKTREWKICGVGNMALRMTGYLMNKGHVSYNGIVGHNIPNTMHDQIMSAENLRQFVITSDGIGSRWDLSKYPLIQKHDLAIQAGVIYKDFARKSDDMCIVMGKTLN